MTEPRKHLETAPMLDDATLLEAIIRKDHNTVVSSFYGFILKEAVKRAEADGREAEDYFAEMTMAVIRSVDNFNSQTIGQFTRYVTTAVRGAGHKQTINDHNKYTGMGQRGRDVYYGRVEDEALKAAMMGRETSLESLLDENDEPATPAEGMALMELSPPTPEDVLLRAEAEQQEGLRVLKVHHWMFQNFSEYERDVVTYFFEHGSSAELHGKTKTCFTRTLNRCLEELRGAFA